MIHLTPASLALQRFVAAELAPLERAADAPPLPRRAAAMLDWLYGLLADAAARAAAARRAGEVTERTVALDPRDAAAGLGRFYEAVPAAARAAADPLMRRGHVASRAVRGRAVSLTVVFPESAGDAADGAEARAMADRVFAWLDAAAAFAPAGCSRTLAVFVVMAGAAKALPAAPGAAIGERHVNSGLTVSCARDGDIYVYRREEWFKVFVHESIHSLGVDFSAMSAADLGDINACVKRTFPLEKPDLRVFEAYCEAWAEVVNALACVLARAGRGPPRAAIARQLALERRWSVFQCAKIMRFQGVAYAQLFSAAPAYREADTYTFSYYAAKMIIMHNLGAFLEWCAAHNANVVGFRNDRATGLAFCGFLRELRAAPGMMRVVAAHEKWHAGRRAARRRGAPEMTTLRMAATEF